MRVTFLGTGTSHGIPLIGCNCEVCTSIDFRQQVLRERINHLTALIFTHQHKDHTAGLDDVRSYNYIQDKHIPVYGRRSVLEHLKKEFEYIFAEEKYPGIPLIDLIEIENKPFSVEGVEFIPIEVFHYKLPVFGYRIKDFTYITDANRIPESEKHKIKGSKVIVLNALHKAEHISHFNLEQAIEVLDEFKPEKAYLIHLGHRMGLHREVEKELPDYIRIAYDGLKLEL